MKFKFGGVFWNPRKGVCSFASDAGVLWREKLSNIGQRNFTSLGPSDSGFSSSITPHDCVTWGKCPSSVGLCHVTCKRRNWPWPLPALTASKALILSDLFLHVKRTNFLSTLLLANLTYGHNERNFNYC